MPKQGGGAESPAKSLDRWTERDLHEAVEAGILSHAFEVDDVIEQVGEILLAGCVPVLTGPTGVGKTTVVHELAWRASAGEGPVPLRGRRIVQLSFRRRAAALTRPAAGGTCSSSQRCSR